LNQHAGHAGPQEPAIENLAVASAQHRIAASGDFKINPGAPPVTWILLTLTSLPLTSTASVAKNTGANANWEFLTTTPVLWTAAIPHDGLSGVGALDIRD
jgi:hypothetical protein